MSELTSRFVCSDDLQTRNFIFDLHLTWWSRFYEYPWAAQFAEANDIVLDAASGICHPLKFYLSDHTHETHACDVDPRILQPLKILEDVEEAFGTNARINFPERYIKNIHYSQASLIALPYPDKIFDKIFCISVLEHLNDYFNKHSSLWSMRSFLFFAQKEIYYSLREFKRTLKDDGLLILTFDYPRIKLDYLLKVISLLNLSFAADVSFDLPDNALFNQSNNLYCFRAILKKKYPW
jgi:SAM-dependent methyltransferase